MKITRLKPGLIIAAFILLILSACSSNPRQNNQVSENEGYTASDDAGETITKAICILYPTEGNDVRGTVTFTMNNSVVKVVAELQGLTPGKHGFHIHENGDCSASDASSAGGHFNPGDSDHGGPADQKRHVGDLGNIEAGEDGHARLEFEDQNLTFTGAHSIIGRAVVVHEGEDDLTSQPAGDAGGRIACGVIGVAK